MTDFPVSAANSYIQFGWEETTYGTASASIDKAFGHNQKITVTKNRNWNLNWGLGGFDAQTAVSAKFSGQAIVEFDMASSYFWKAVMGKANDSIDGDSKTHTYVDNTSNAMTSVTIEYGVDLDTDNVYNLLGCVLNTCEITGRVGEAVHVRLTFDYAKETKATTGLDSSPATDAETILTYAEGTLEIPDTAILNRVEEFILTITRNPEIKYGMGSAIGTHAVWRNREWRFRFTMTYENDDMVEDFYGQAASPLSTTIPTGEASLQLTFTNGGASSALRKQIVTLTTTYLESLTERHDVKETLNQEIVGFSLGNTSIVGYDDTITCP